MSDEEKLEFWVCLAVWQHQDRSWLELGLKSWASSHGPGFNQTYSDSFGAAQSLLADSTPSSLPSNRTIRA
jgi:hypothetical protein